MSTAERRLAGIMFVDLAGFTSLSQRNEALAMRLVEECRGIVRPLFIKHEGREVKTIGDGFLVEFESALEAVRCAFVIQQTLHTLNSGRRSDERLALRIGIHVGDVIRSAGDVMGDAVNIASRIEPLAQPGGVSISRQVYDQVKNKFEFPFISMGSRQLKGLAGALEVFSVSFPWDKEEEGPPALLDPKRLAVLPLANISNDPNDEYFADGMTEELISTISRIRGLRVIARTSAMQYKGQTKRISEIGNELKAGTLIEGSVRKSSDMVRITVQLIDAASEEHLWSEDYERKLENIFQIQREIATKVAEGLRVKLLPEEESRIGRKDTVNPEAFTLYLKGRYYWNERTEEGMKKAAGYFQRAIDLDPLYARAYSGLSDAYSILAFQNYMPAQEAIPKAKALAEKAVEIDEGLAEAHTSLGFVTGEMFDWAGAESHYRRALELNPSYATAHFWYGIQLMWMGNDEAAIEHSKQAEELDPLSPAIAVALGQAFVYTRHYDEAIDHLERKAKEEPDATGIHFILGIAYFCKGMFEKAEEEERKSIAVEETDRRWALLGAALAKMGRVPEARGILGKLEGSGAPNVMLAMMNAELAESERALDYLEKAVAVREPGLGWISVIPSFDSLKPDPRFGRILRGMNLPVR